VPRRTDPHESAMLLCQVHGRTFAIDRGVVRAIERSERITWSPDSWPMVGTLPAREDEIPVYSIPGLVGEAPVEADRGGRVLVCHGEGRDMGFLVDRVQPLNTESGAEWRRMPRSIGSELFSWVRALGDSFVPVIDLSSLGVCTKAGMPTNAAEAPAAAFAVSRSTRLMLISVDQVGDVERPFWVGIPERGVAEVIEGGASQQVIGSSFGIRGCKNQILPVIDLAARLGVEPAASDAPLKTLILLASRSNEYLALRITGRCRALSLPIPHLEASDDLPEDFRSRFQSVIVTNSATIGLLDIHTLLEPAEPAAV
jgi:chemotaxis signal transduction protein